MLSLPTTSLGVLFGTLLLTACSGAPVAPADSQEDLEARCVRTGGRWRESPSYSQISGHCEYRR